MSTDRASWGTEKCPRPWCRLEGARMQDMALGTRLGDSTPGWRRHAEAPGREERPEPWQNFLVIVLGQGNGISTGWHMRLGSPAKGN
jgi:hypothetical protein